jgi:glycosyltransferase involved in cell wall biosynthesis
MSEAPPQNAPRLSIAIRAWNEEAIIGRSLNSLFEQSLFARLQKRGERCEVVCIPNGCTDRTAAVAEGVFAGQRRRHPFSRAFTCRVVEITEAGRNHTWNAYVHAISDPQAQFLYLMDSDILFNEPDTLFNMYLALLDHPHARISTDRQVKDIALKGEKSLIERLSLATTDMTRTIEGQMTGQLYCIRSKIARRIWLPKDLGAPDDGLIKALVCSDFFNEAPDPDRIITAPKASHVYEAYTSPGEVLNNQKRQMIGQTTVHVLIEYVKSLPARERDNLAAHLRARECANPAWLRQLTGEHLRRHRHFWQLFPNLLAFRFQRWKRLKPIHRLTHLPAALAGFGVTLIACALASRHFRRGGIGYWPKASRANIQRLNLAGG